MRNSRFLSTLILCVFGLPAFATDYKPETLDSSYQHDKWVTLPVDFKKEFRAFTVSFDTADDDNGDETADVWAIPQWVAYQIKKFPGTLGSGPDRPSPWITEVSLHSLKIAPDDASYHFTNEWRAENLQSKFLGYDRGHLCMKQHAFRLGPEADWNTHTMLNCVPQRADLNQGIWLDLENKSAKWADKFNSVWIITGPVVYGLEPDRFLGQRENDEVMVAIPDAFFKIAVREETGSDPAVMAFIYHQRGRGYKKSGGYDHTPYLTNVNAIEHFTGLDFLTALPDDVEERVEKVTATELWPEQ